MTTLENPQIQVKVFGVDSFTIADLFMDFSISKDQDEEPNDADLSIYNLNEDKRASLAAGNLVETPIEIHLTKAGGTQLVRAFAGEIETVRNHNMRPGHETQIHCTSAKSSHYSECVDQLTFVKGTPAAQIILSLVDAIGLTPQIETLPVVPIKLSQSFTGNAFKQLVKFCRDYGLRCFVLDDTLRIVSIYAPQNLVPKVILPSMLLSKPIQTTITDEELIEQMSVTETASFDDLAANPKKKKRRKRSKVRLKKPFWMSKKAATVSADDPDFAEYDAVDTRVDGWDFECMLQPDIDPDDLITVATTETAGKLLRVREVEHHGENETFDDWTTEIRTSVYEAL